MARRAWCELESGIQPRWKVMAITLTPHPFGWCSRHAWKVLGGLGRSIIACSWSHKRPDAPMAVERFGEADQKHGGVEGEANSAFVRVTLLKRLERKHATF
jgi:hypothetical protein